MDLQWMNQWNWGTKIYKAIWKHFNNFRISRLKRTKIWVRNIPSVPPLIRDEVDEYIEAQKRLKEIEENDFEAIFDSPADSTKIDSAKIEMESTLKLAILGRLKENCSKY